MPLMWPISRLDIAEERIKEAKGRSIKTSKTEKGGSKYLYKSMFSIFFRWIPRKGITGLDGCPILHFQRFTIPLLNDWIKMWYIYRKKYHLAIKNGILSTRT